VGFEIREPMIRVEDSWFMVQGIGLLPWEGPTNSQARFKIDFSGVPVHGFDSDSGEQSRSKVSCTEIGIPAFRCRVNTAHVKQSWPDSGLGFQVEFNQPFQLFPLRSEAETPFA